MGNKTQDYKLNGFGYGSYPQTETLVQNIPFAIDSGYTIIDTSDNYHNEEFVGEGLKSCSDRNFVIISKFSQPRKTKMLKSCFDESKKKLDGKLNLYLLHWPYPFLWKVQWRKMEELYLSGEVEAIGVCNFEVKKLKKLLKFCKVKPAVNEIERHPLFQQNDIVDFCKQNGVQIVCYSPLARFDAQLFNNKVIQEISNKYGKTAGQVILRWDLDCDCIPIPGATSEEHIKENIDVFDFSLTPNELTQIAGQEAGYRIRYDPNKRFTLRQKIRFLIERVKLFWPI